MSKRTTWDLEITKTLWPIVEYWASRTGYREVSRSGDTQRTYQKGYGILMAPTMLLVSNAGTTVHLEAWIRVPPLNQMASLFILPKEMGIEAGGIRLILPREIARDDMDDLVEVLTAT